MATKKKGRIGSCFPGVRFTVCLSILKNYHLILLLKWNGGEGEALKESMQKGDTHS